jgi:hypothetical protein
MGKVIMKIRESGGEMRHDVDAALSSICVRVTLARGVETLIQVEGSATVHLAVEDCGTALMVYLANPSQRLKTGSSSEHDAMDTQLSPRLDSWI